MRASLGGYVIERDVVYPASEESMSETKQRQVDRARTAIFSAQRDHQDSLERLRTVQAQVSKTEVAFDKAVSELAVLALKPAEPAPDPLPHTPSLESFVAQLMNRYGLAGALAVRQAILDAYHQGRKDEERSRQEASEGSKAAP